MSEIEEIKKRISRLEEMMDAAIGVLNKLIDDIYEPCYVKKLDRMADRLIKEKENEQESET